MIYERPSMKRVELRCNRNVADTCWGYAASKDESEYYYYEVSNTEYGGKNTYVGFKISAASGNASCKDITNVSYRIYSYASGLDTDAKKVAAQKELDDFLDQFNQVPNGGSPFNSGGLATTLGPSW